MLFIIGYGSKNPISESSVDEIFMEMEMIDTSIVSISKLIINYRCNFIIPMSN